MRNRSPRALFLLYGALGLLGVAMTGCKTSVSSDVAATVDGRPISYAELERQMASQAPETLGSQTGDSALAYKLETLRIMIDSEILLQRAEKAGLIAVDAEVEAKFNQLRAPYTQEDFQKQLRMRKMSEADFKAQLRKDLSIEKLLNKEIGSHISISDADVAVFYNTNKASFNLAEARVHLAQILVTPTPDPNVHNLKKDKAQNDEQAKKKMAMIEMRLRQGEDFGALAQNYSEDAKSSPNGGDYGFIPESALSEANVELRKAILALPSGGVSAVIHTPEGYRIIKVIAKEPAGQRELSDPRVQESIRTQLFNQKDQLLRDAFVETSRNEAKVVDYFAQSILGNRDKR